MIRKRCDEKHISDHMVMNRCDENVFSSYMEWKRGDVKVTLLTVLAYVKFSDCFMKVAK
jgi:hypothetical protein